MSIDYGLTESELITFDSPEHWAHGRHCSIGSSDGATILGEGYAGSSVYALWAEKCHGIKPEFTAATLRMFEKGKLAEPYISGLCRIDKGWDVQFDPRPSFRRNLTRTYLTASLDAWMIEDGQHVALEFKNVNAFAMRKEWNVEKGAVPLKYTIQLQHQLAVTGWKKGYVIALSGYDIKPIEVHRHDRLIEAMLAEYDDFWALVRDKKEPEIDDSDATCVTIDRVYKKEPMGARHLDDESSAMLDGLLELEESIKHDEKTLATYRNKLAAIAAGAEFLVTSDGQMYSFKSPRGGGKRKLKLMKGSPRR